MTDTVTGIVVNCVADIMSARSAVTGALCQTLGVLEMICYWCSVSATGSVRNDVTGALCQTLGVLEMMLVVLCVSYREC